MFKLSTLSISMLNNSTYMWCFQFDVMKRYMDGGGSILVMTGEGGESRFDTNINFFLEEFGINVNTGMLVNEILFLEYMQFSIKILVFYVSSILHCDQYFPVQKRLIWCIYQTYNIGFLYIYHVPMLTPNILHKTFIFLAYLIQ